MALEIGHQLIIASKMMRERYYKAPNDNKTTILLVIIKPNFALANNCIEPPCYSCLLARARNRTPNVWRTCLLDNRDGALTRDQYNMSDFVSTEQFICKTPGRLPTGYGCESQYRHFQGGTNIFNDAASVLKWVENSVSLGANETVMGKTSFKQWLYDQ